METVTISSLIGNVGEIFTGAIGWVGDVADAITGNPYLLFFGLIPLVGLGVGLFNRLRNVG